MDQLYLSKEVDGQKTECLSAQSHKYDEKHEESRALRALSNGKAD